MRASRAFQSGITPVAYALKEAERAARAKQAVGWRFSLPLLRLREVERVIVARHGPIVPDPEDTDDRPWCLDYARAAECSASAQDLYAWARRWCPWAAGAELDAIVADEGWRQWMIGADEVATMLFVSGAERQALALNTIGACDLSKAERAVAADAAKLQRDRERQEAARRAAGAVDRATYLSNSITAQEPWKAAGKSRATYYRDLKAERETGASRITLDSTTRDGLVSPPGLDLRRVA